MKVKRFVFASTLALQLLALPSAFADTGDSAVQLDTPVTAEKYIERGISRLNAQEPISAIEDMDQAILLNPSDSRSYFWRAYARDLISAKTQLGGGKSETFEYRGNCLPGSLANRNCSRWEQSIADYTQVLKLSSDKPSQVKALVGRGNDRYRFGDRNSALADLDEAIRLDPENAFAYFSRGRMRYVSDNALIRQDWQKAADLYRAQGDAASADELRQALNGGRL